MSEKKVSSAATDVAAASIENADEQESQGWDQKATKRLLWKLDLHILPFMTLAYLLCFLDRANIGNARLENLESDLGLHKLQYNNCLVIFYPFYMAAEIPSNMMMKRLKPSRWLTFIMVAWSACMIGQGFVKNYAGLLTTRALLGLFEAGLYPGVNYYITQWYLRHECGFRMALFFAGAQLSGAFGGILARGISEMRGLGGLPGWAWIFVLEGIITMLVSFTAPWAIYDYPDTARFLKPAERQEVQRRLKDEQGRFGNGFKLKYVADALKDWKLYVHTAILTAAATCSFSFSLFLPTIIRDLGYTANTAQLMSVPPHVVASFVAVAVAWYADRIQIRGPFMLGLQLVLLTGLVMLISTSRSAVNYAGTVLATTGAAAQVPLGYAWSSGNTGGSLKRGTGIAMHAMGGQIGGIIASYVYLNDDAPRFIKGHSILIGFVSTGILLTLFMTTWCKRENARRDALPSTNSRGMLDGELTDEQKAREEEMAESVEWFRFII